MESMIFELKRTLLQQIPNGLTLIFAIGSLTALVFLFLKRRHGKLYLCFWLLILFMLLWRMVTGVISTRYVAMLVVPAGILTALVGLRSASCLRVLHRKIPAIPQWSFQWLPRLFLLCITGGLLLMARHDLSSQQDIYRKVYAYAREYSARHPDATVLVRLEEESNLRYYTGVRTGAYYEETPQSILATLHHPFYRGKHLLIAMRYSRKEAPVFESRLLPAGAELKLLHAVQGRKKRKSVFFYRCTWRAGTTPSHPHQADQSQGVLR